MSEDFNFGPSFPGAEVIEKITKEEETTESRPQNVDRKKEWDSVRGSDEIIQSNQNRKLERDTWMVELPAQRSSSLNFDLMQKSVTRFSLRGVEERGDTSMWTQTPDQKEPQRPKTSLEMAKAMAMQHIEQKNNQATSEIVKQYNEKFRKESLFEQHIKQKEKTQEEEEDEVEEKEEKKTKKKEKKKSKDKDEDKKGKKRKHRSSSSSSKKKKRNKSDESESDSDSDDSRDEKPKKKKQKRDKKSDKKEEKKKEYVPYWDRERDLNKSGIDAKKAVNSMAQSGVLNMRFSSSSSSFL
eukprot:TRINITY_DN2258_c0_g1_i2.p1 TRINITY_DN2258_c0_g1~~TRINITY_DN2258_c0_g1_i2.p1  ORF type:complete len:297 (-),score=99.10 TRINITY_DN2258_c0_g1_i2:45-935(-)